MNFSDEDQQQFAQLIGHSLSGYGELSYVSDASYNDAEGMSIEPVRASLEHLLKTLEKERQGQHECMTLIAMADPVGDAIAAARRALDRRAQQPPAEGGGPILQWSEKKPPCEDCRYDHCIAETPFGRFLITWKGWKEYDSPTVDETPWGDWYGVFSSVDEAKAACQQGMEERLARWGRPAAPPAEGEAQEIADHIRAELKGFHPRHRVFGELTVDRLTRAATLLQQQHLQPVPVSERLPGPEDCDAEGNCWWWRTDGIDAFWEFIILRDPIGHNLGCGGKVSYGPWLPHFAISLPDDKEIQQ